MNKSAVLMILSVVAVAIFLVTSQSPQDKGGLSIEWGFSDNADFIIGVLPYRSDEEIQEDLKMLTAYLEKHLSRPVKLNVALDYSSLARLMKHDKIQMAWFSHALFEQSDSRHDWEILCRPAREEVSTHYGAVVVKDDSDWQNIAQLSGARIAYVDRLSGSGFVYPARLFRAIGMDPVASFSQVVFTGNHSRSADAVIEGLVDAAAIFCDVTGSATDTAILPEGLRALAWTDPIPGDPLVVNRKLDAQFIKKLRSLLTEMQKYEGGSEALAWLKDRRGFSGFYPENR